MTEISLTKHMKGLYLTKEEICEINILSDKYGEIVATMK